MITILIRFERVWLNPFKLNLYLLYWSSPSFSSDTPLIITLLQFIRTSEFIVHSRDFDGLSISQLDSYYPLIGTDDINTPIPSNSIILRASNSPFYLCESYFNNTWPKFMALRLRSRGHIWSWRQMTNAVTSNSGFAATNTYFRLVSKSVICSYINYTTVDGLPVGPVRRIRPLNFKINFIF